MLEKKKKKELKANDDWVVLKDKPYLFSGFSEK